jgi:hypothetical protein
VAERARPTLRCLREDLALPVPRVDTPLEEITHPLLVKATERFADEGTPQERISAIDDQVLFKVKVQRWRGAVWADAGIPWLRVRFQAVTVPPRRARRKRAIRALIFCVRGLIPYARNRQGGCGRCSRPGSPVLPLRERYALQRWRGCVGGTA